MPAKKKTKKKAKKVTEQPNDSKWEEPKKTLEASAKFYKAKREKAEKDKEIEQVQLLQSKCVEALKQAREIVDMEFTRIDSKFRHRLDCSTERHWMVQMGVGYLAFQALLELTQEVNRLMCIFVDCKDLSEEMRKLD